MKLQKDFIYITGLSEILWKIFCDFYILKYILGCPKVVYVYPHLRKCGIADV